MELKALTAERVRLRWESARAWRIPLAYVSTALDAIFRGRRLHRAFYQPVSYRAARRFWGITLGILVVSFSAAAADWLLLPGNPAAVSSSQRFAFSFQQHGEIPFPYEAGVLRQWVEDFGLLPVVAGILGGLAGGITFIIIATGAPSYAFHPRKVPRELQNRAVALTYYAPASLLIVPPGLVLTRIIAPQGAEHLNNLLAVYGGVLLAGAALYMFHLVCLAQRCFRRTALTARVMIVTPLLWSAAAVVSLLFGISVAYVVWILIDLGR